MAFLGSSMPIRNKVAPGNRRVLVDEYNAFLAMTRQAGDGLLSAGFEDYYQATRAYVKNTTAEKIDAFGVLGLDSPVITRATNTPEFFGSPTFNGVTPDIDLHAGKFAILQEPAMPGDTVRAVIAGATWAWLEVLSESDTTAEVEDGATVTVITGTSGTAKILWKEAGVGVRAGLIALNVGSPAAQFIGFTLTEDMAANKSEEATITSAWGSSCDVGETATVHDPQAIWRDAIEGCKGIAVLDKCLQAESDDPDEPYYRIVHCQRAAKRAKAALSAAMCGSSPAISSPTWMTYQQGDFVADPGPGVIINLAGHRGMTGDFVWLERVSNTQPFQWHVVDVEKHALQLLTCATSLSGDPAELVKCCVTAAVEVCELPPCAEEETSSSAPTSSSPAPDIPFNSSVYACCEMEIGESRSVTLSWSQSCGGSDSVETTWTEAGQQATIGPTTITGSDLVSAPSAHWCTPVGACSCSPGHEKITIVCTEEEDAVPRTDPDVPSPPGVYLRYEWRCTSIGTFNCGSRTMYIVVPAEVLSCEPLHIRASFNPAIHRAYIYCSGTWIDASVAGMLDSNPEFFNGSVNCDIDVELTE